jgi:hypothetical protein
MTAAGLLGMTVTEASIVFSVLRTLPELHALAAWFDDDKPISSEAIDEIQADLRRQSRERLADSLPAATPYWAEFDVLWDLLLARQPVAVPAAHDHDEMGMTRELVPA